MPLRPYRASIIGCGRVAWMLEEDPLEAKPCTHMGAYQALGRDLVEVVSASDVDRTRLEAFSRKYGVSPVYEDFREMLSTERPEIVSVCAYAPERLDMVTACVRAGVRGIWCEKAFGTSLAEARKMKQACEAGGTELIVSHLRRWSPRYRKAKEMIDAGAIGRVTSAVCHFSGSLMHTGTHAFDVLNWFLGRPEWVEGELDGESKDRPAGEFLWDTETDPGARATIGYSSGAYAAVHADTMPYFFFEFDFLGTGGRIRIGNNDVLEYFAPKDSTHYTGIKELSLEPFPPLDDKNIWEEALRNLIDCVEGKGENPNGPDSGLEALEVALAVHHSSVLGGARVELPLKKSEITVRSR